MLMFNAYFLTSLWTHQIQVLFTMTLTTRVASPNHRLRTPTHFSSRSTMDWGEDDAWDSASDEESSHPAPPRASNTSSYAPKPTLNTSSSTLDSPYTYLSTPNPSSYPPRPQQDTQRPQNGWTIVRKSHRESIDTRGKQKSAEDNTDPDVEGDMIIGDLELDGAEPTSNTKPRQDHGSIREDVDEVINGTS